MTTIYILKLEHDCFYVGKTNNYSKRINDHINNSGALWTKLHKVIGEDKIISNCSPFDEDKYVKEYMAKYGIDKVRGGSYVTQDLSDEQYNLLTNEIWAATNACTRCGRKNHFIKDCYAKTDIYNNIIDEEYIYNCNKCDKEFNDEKLCIVHMKKCNDTASPINEKYNCIYCNKEFNTKKNGIYHQNLHCKLKPNKNNANDCYAKTTINGEEIIDSSDEEIEVYYCSYCNKEFDTLKGATCHENLYCKNKKNIINSNNNLCYRCGRDGHYSSNCYASKHINGKYLN